jgi:hypothetical protein
MIFHWVNIIQPITDKNKPIYNLDKCFFDYMWYCWENKLDAVIKNTFSNNVIYSVTHWQTITDSGLGLWGDCDKENLKSSKEVYENLQSIIRQTYTNLFRDFNIENSPRLPMYNIAFKDFGAEQGAGRGTRPLIEVIDNFGSFTETNGNGSLADWVRWTKFTRYIFLTIKKGIILYANTHNNELNSEGLKLFNNPLDYDCGVITDINEELTGFCVPKNM